MVDIHLIPKKEIDRILDSVEDRHLRLSLTADICRANALATVKRAGSGHLGSSFSSLDIITFLYFDYLNVRELGVDHPDRDVYFSSKGHDVPGQYAVLYALGVIPESQFLRLRRLGGTYGHPDVSIPGIEANTGSLGMGISKARGIAVAKQIQKRSGRVLVMTGDGELQEGQIYEALQTTVHQNVSNVTVIVDHNKVQSDREVKEIVDLGDMEKKFTDFGWYVRRCDGHDFSALGQVFAEFDTVTDRPKILIADTVKGQGVSFMEHPRALASNNGLYPWHAGAPKDEPFSDAYRELTDGVNQRLEKLDLDTLSLTPFPPDDRQHGLISKEYVADSFGDALVDISRKRTDVVVLDADLSADCRLRKFEYEYPDRFIENGIAEQDMVSMAGGLALQGLLPVVNSFGVFLASRANEQIYNNVTERTKIIYVCHFAGVIPSAPGLSHQSIRDISLMGMFPDMEILQPSNPLEARMVLDYCINTAEHGTMIRLNIGPSPRIITLPDSYTLSHGAGVSLTEGSDALLMAYGPVMLHEALLAGEALAKKGIGVKIVNHPWLNRLSREWFADIIKSFTHVFVMDDHAPVGGLYDTILRTCAPTDMLTGRSFVSFAVEGYPACGDPREVLRHHNLDGDSIAARIEEQLK